MHIEDEDVAIRMCVKPLRIREDLGPRCVFNWCLRDGEEKKSTFKDRRRLFHRAATEDPSEREPKRLQAGIIMKACNGEPSVTDCDDNSHKSVSRGVESVGSDRYREPAPWK